MSDDDSGPAPTGNRSIISTAAPDISTEEVTAVVEAMNRGVLSTGELVSEFERRFASMVGVESGAAVCSGSVGLELAFEVSDLPRGSGIVVSPRNCASVLYSILNQGHTPVFADVKSDGMNLDPRAVDRAIDRADGPVEAVLATHLHGSPCDLDGLSRVADERGLTLIEDICQCPGATYDGDPAGSFGSLAVCSFGATKNLTTAEGGIVVGDDETKIERVRKLRSSRHGQADEPLRSVRMSDLEAAMGLKQLDRYEEMVERRREAAEIYQGGLEDAVSLPNWEPEATHVYLNFPIFVDDPAALQTHLRRHDVESATYESLLSTYDCLEREVSATFPNAEKVIAETLVLPMHSKLSSEDASSVVNTVRDYVVDR